MRDIDRREAEFLADAADLASHFQAQTGIQIRKRFIEQKAARTHHQCASEGDTLLLSTRKLGDFAISVFFHLYGL